MFVSESQVSVVFWTWDIHQNVPHEFIELSFKQYSCVPRRGTNVAAWNELKHLEFSFDIKAITQP